MNGQADAGCERAAAGVQPVGAIRSHRHVMMLIAPVPDVVGKQVGAQTKRGHAPEHRRVDHLAVVQRVTMIGPRRPREYALGRVDRHETRFVFTFMRCPLAWPMTTGPHNGRVIRLTLRVPFGRVVSLL